ncbi:hypothetical protein LB505_006628 [Fusarium chuoi]|nr:hypothetical protein LB505_006628 [Fusarium chuoi]
MRLDWVELPNHFHHSPDSKRNLQLLRAVTTRHPLQNNTQTITQKTTSTFQHIPYLIKKRPMNRIMT